MFVIHCAYGESRSTLLIESADCMIPREGYLYCIAEELGVVHLIYIAEGCCTTHNVSWEGCTSHIVARGCTSPAV